MGVLSFFKFLPRSNLIKKLGQIRIACIVTSLLLISAISSCGGGGSEAVPTSTSNHKVKPFLGAEKAFANDDGTWDVWWPPILGISDVRYEVFQRLPSEEFDFSIPVTTTKENTYKTPDLRLVGNTCFVVRFVQAASKTDNNTQEICTNHETYNFKGLESLVSLRDGSYTLKWAQPPFKGAKFQIYSRGKFDQDWKSLAVTTDSFYRTRKIALNEVICFNVRYIIDGFPPDTNETSQCTRSIEQSEFLGITNLDSPAEGELTVQWQASNDESVSGYNIYLGSDFKQKIATVEGRESSSYTIKNLLHGVVYTVGVLVFDAYGREDQNRRVLSYELANHLPLVTNVTWQVISADSNGRPSKLKCVAEYQDDDDWQKLRPTFQFKNRKRNNLGVVERTIIEGSVNQAVAEYDVINEDHRADELICEVKVSDTFGISATVTSLPLVVPDTPVIASGMLLMARENTELDVIITRGVGQGYTDFDNDNATEILFNTSHGTMTSSPAFTCIDGTCTGRFKPDKDFYTDTDSATPQYASISYQVRAGDSLSGASFINMVVKPVPRALGFDMFAKQDEDRFGEVGKSTVLDANNDVVTFSGYTHVLNHNPTMIYLRHPLSEADYKGKVKLPNTITADPANGIKCEDIAVASWATPGFECGIPCSGGKCPFVFRADNGYYGPAAFDYAVVIDGILSNYATARVNVLPFLQATGYNALTVEGRTFEIKMSEGQGFQGSGNGIEVTNVIASNIVGTSQSVTFTKNASNEWVATFVPDAGFKGYATFDYRLSAINQTTGLVIQSNSGLGKVHFYPNPIATGIAVQSLENNQKMVGLKMAISPTVKDGYYQEYLDPAKDIEIFNIQLARGYVVEIGAGNASGSKTCTTGLCNITFAPANNYYDTNSSTHLKFSYRVRTEINGDLFSTPNLVIDPFLDTPANRILVSNDANANFDIRPVPKANNLSLVVAESLPGFPTMLPINMSNVSAPPTYSHILGYLANTITIVDPPSQGAMGAFTCSGAGACSGTYIPAVNQMGQLAPTLSYTVTIFDPEYLQNSGLIASLPASLDIDVRPMPKPQSVTLAVAENTSFAASSKVITVEKDTGYTHALNYLATGANLVEAGTTNGVLGGVACASGSCTATYTPNQDYFGVTNFNFNVTVNDPKLGNLTSPNGTVALDVRPRPRATNLGSLAAPQRVDENTAKSFQLNLGTEYSHPYGIKASGITIVSATHYSVYPAGSCNAAGVCTIAFNPELNFEGTAEVTYKVAINDPVLNSTLESNIGTLFIDIYPAPRATNKQAYVVQNSTTPVVLELRTGNLLDEDAFALADHKGYAHRRDGKATAITVSNLTRGALDPFTCDAAGLCTSNYQALDFLVGQDDGFDYKVTVNGLQSNLGHFTLKILPAAVAINLNKVTVEDTALDIMVIKGTGTGYTHPQDESASRIEIMGSSQGTPAVTDLNGGDPNKNCDATGSCKIVFTPNVGYSSPDNNMQEAYVQYRVWTFNAEFGGEIPSNTATVFVNVRPKPKAQNMTVTSRQGTNGSVLFTIGSAYTYNAGNGRVDKIAIIPATAQNGTVDQNEYLCNASGICGPATFAPGTMGDGSPYYGNGASFQFKAVIYDTYLNADIESGTATVTLDFRPVPTVISKHFVLWQGRNLALQLSPGNGYSHPYYATNPNQFKAKRMIIVAPPTHGTLTGTVGEFFCDGGTHICAETFTPETGYFYDGSSGFLTFSYKVVVNDPIYGDIESNVAQSTIEVRAVPVNVGKSVKGVQNVDKPLSLSPGNGFTYPTVMPSVPVITISNPVNGNLVSPFVCDINGCSAFFRTSNSGITGLTSFQYKITFNDPVLGAYDSEVKTYEMDFYPIPTATSFVHPVSSFQGYEGQDFTLKLLPGNSDTMALCYAGSQTLAPKLAYTHKFCNPAVEAIIIPSSTVNGSFVEGLSLSCNPQGNCTGTFRPNSAAGSWQGFGVAQFDYRVRINPTELQSESLSPTEIAALISNAATAQVEFKPVPWATGVTLQDINPATDYIYAVQNYSQTLTIERCNTPTTKEQCHKGYVHGYDENASTVHNFSLSNLTLNPWTCIAGNCTTQLRPVTDYYSPGAGDFATFEYDVAVGAQTSNRAQVKVKVYPIPVSQTKSSYGLENEDLVLTIAAGDGYSHPLSANAIKIDVVVPPDEAKGNLVNPASPAQVLKASLGHDLSTAFTCSAGTCTATYRPEPGTGGLNSLWFRTMVAGPTEMSTALKSQLVSTQKQYTIQIDPKPVATSLETVLVEGVQTPFNIGLNNGYTHEFSAPAEKVNFLDAQYLVPNTVRVNSTNDRGILQGTIACSGGVCDLNCTSGNCGGVFTPNAGFYSTTSQIQYGCTAAGANCPTLDYRATVRTGSGLLAQSENTGSLRFNVRPKPRANTAPVNLMAAEGEDTPIELKNTSGYTHPFYGAKSITKQGTTHGDISAAFVCQEVAGVPGVCTSTFVPTVGFQPTLADHNATITYKVTVTDPTELNPAVGPQTVGDLLSPDVGTVTIEYRPKPRATTANVVGRQDTNTGIVIDLNQGYTHTYNTPATKLIIVANTYSHATVQGCTTNNDCTITCTAGICNATMVPEPGYYGAASFQYKIAINDSMFTPTRELISPNSGTVNVDVRPLPVANDMTYATKVNTPVTLTLKPLLNLGYTHPYGDKAKSVTITSAVTNGSITTAFVCDTNSGSPTFGECAGTYTPNNDFFGAGTFSYYVTTRDNVLNADLNSTIKNVVINVRPEPVATGLLSTVTTWENQNRNVSIANGLIVEKKGYYYPNELAPEYDIHPNSILLDTSPNAAYGSFPAAFSCSTGAMPKGCDSNFVVASNIYGSTSFTYRVRMQDPVLAQFTTSNSSVINLEIRPIPRSFDTSYTNNTSLKAIEGTPLTWEIRNSSTMGYTYPTDAAYTSVLNTMVITATDAVGGNGTIQAGASCATGICSGVFTPDAGYSGSGATFKFKVGVTDSSLVAGNQFYETVEKTASVDVYPRPIANNFTSYTLENAPLSVSIAAGAGLGYTHGRTHPASGIHVTQVVSGNAMVDTDFACNAGTCSATFTPTNNFYSTANNAANAAKLRFQVDVTEPGASPRTARSNNEGELSFIVYPKPVISVGAPLTNIPAWEGENTAVAIAAGTGSGYTHAWGDQAKAVSIEAVSTGSSLTGAFACSTGTCSNQFVAKEGTYGNGAAYFDYKAKTEFVSLADPNAWSATTGRVTFNVRAVPKVPASFSLTGVENTNLTSQTIGLNNGYTYGDSANRSISKIELREFNNTYTHVTCQGGCGQYTCTAGTCTLPQLVPELDYDRTDGVAKLEYRVMVHDELFGAGTDKWSAWTTLNVNLLPKARGTVVDRNNAIEATPYALTISLNDGYTHAENIQATKIRIKGGTNLSGLSIGSEVDCVAGVCSLTVNPITTAFSDITGKPSNSGQTYGWGALNFDVLAPVDGTNIWSTQGTAQIYFRPVPKPDSVTVATAIENEYYDVTIRLAGTGSCVSGCGYTHALGGFATAISVFGATATVQGTPSCNSSTGVCTARFFSATAGAHSFQYKVTVDGLQQIDAGTASVTFVPRPRTENLAAVTVEERYVDININRGAGLGYTHTENHDAKDVVVSNVANGTVQQVLDGANGSACTTAGASIICNCRTNEALCVVRFTPRTWVAGENTVMGGFDFKVRDSIYKEADGITPLASMNQSTVTIEERPIPRAFDVSYASNAYFKAIEGTNLNWQINNGSGLGYTYSTDPKYNTVRATTQITTTDVAGGHGAILASPSCTNGVCSGVFIPEGGYFGNGAFFKYRVTMTDTTLPAGTQTLQTEEKTAFIDVFPRPIANNFTVYTAENSALAVAIAKGAGAGYTHDRNDNATAISITGTSQTTALSGVDFTCSSGSCTATVTPATNFYSADATLPNAAYFNFKVDVTEAGGSPRVAQSSNTGKTSIIVYPRPIPSVGASLTNIPGWEGETTSIAIAQGTGLGYTHPWNDFAQGINISGISTGSQVGTAFTCAAGTCSGTFIPKDGTYGNGAAYFDFNIRTVYANLTDPNVWASSNGHITLNVRAVPKVPASIAFTGIENTNLINQAVTLNNGYTYGDAANRNISKLEVREYQGVYNHITCQGGCSQYNCTAGTCTFPQLVPETNYDRTDGTAKLEYRVMVHDELFGAGTDKWSPWAILNVPLLPMARGTVVDRLTAIEASSFALSVNLGDGYSHVENAKATKIRIVGGTNLSGLSIGSETDCVNGLCTLTVDPITTAFADIAGKPTNNSLTFGWATLDYEVLVPVDGTPIWSTLGTAQIYFRPVPKPDNVTVATAIEDEPYDVTIRLTGTGSCGSACGYTHPFNHLASAISVYGATATVQGTPSCNAGTGVCTVRFYSLNAGTHTFNYKVTVDGLQQIDGGTASVTFIPRPRTENLSAVTVEERYVDININRGAGLGYTHTENHNAQDVVVSNISNGTIQQVTDGVNGASCTTAGSNQICACRSGEPLCVIRFTPRVWVAGENTVMGTFDFKVRDSIYKEADGTTPLAAKNQSTVTIEERPIPRAHDVSYASNPYFKAIENTNLTWQVSNGSGLGYTYSLDSKYNDVRSTTQITTTDVVGGFGTISPTPSCSNGVCTGIFVPEANYNGNAASFKYRITMTDSALPAGTQTLQTLEKTALIDVYPRPVGNNITAYTAQNLPVSIGLAKGAGVGYTHLRNDNATAVNVTGTLQLAALAGGDFSCSTGTCSASVTPATNFYSADATTGNAAYFDFKVSVTEGGASPRVAEANNSARAYLIVYPRSVPSVGASLTNIPAWEGEATAVSLADGTGLGYTHPWNNLAQAINVTGVSTGSSVSTAFTCGAGICGGAVTTKEGTYGNGAAYFDYQTKTVYANLADPNVWSSSTGRVTFNVRAVPKVPASTAMTGVENTDLINQSVGLNNGYTYGDSANRNISKVELREYQNTYNHITCQGGCTQYNCAGGTCTLPTLVPELDYDRTDGTAKLEYRVMVHDEQYGAGGTDKWSNWATLNVSLLPKARGSTVDRTDAIEATAYNLVLTLNNGYTHVESKQATKIELTGDTNLNGIVPGTLIDCVNGTCTVPVTPITTSFANVAGKPANSGTYGWAQLTYRVLVPVDGVDIWSTTGSARVYFRPVPKPENITIADAIEDETETVEVRLSGTGGCSSGCGYTHAENGYASAITVFNATASVQGTPSCNSSTGVCTVNFYSANYGDYSFQYKVTVNGVQQIDAGTASVSFLPRPRTVNLSASTIEGAPIDINIDRGATLGYTHAHNHNAQDVVVSNISNGTVEQVLDGVNGTACAISGSNKICSCRSGESLCVIRFTPRSWATGEGVLSGTFSFKVRDSVYKEADGSTPLNSKNQSTVSITMNPRLVANTRSYPAGTTQGVEDATKTVQIAAGAGGTGTGGYVHSLSENVTQVQIVTMNNATISGCAGDGCWLNCTAGTCNVNVVPLSGASFATNASFTYHVKDGNGYESHIPGAADVYFYPRPKGTSRTIVVGKNSVDNTLTVQLNDGFTHMLNDNPSSWTAVDTANLNGTLNTYGCSGTSCTVKYTPTAGYTSPNDTTLSTFTYSITNNTASGGATSTVLGTYNIEVFPKPVATGKTLYWVENIGDQTKPAGQEQKVTIRLNQDYIHERGYNPKAISVSNVTGGSFSSAFACSGDTCTATFVPTIVAANNATPASYFDYQVKVVGNYDHLPSDAVRVNIVVMPVPTAKTIVVTGIQGESLNFKFANYDALAGTPKIYDSFSHAWGAAPVDPTDIEIIQQPLQGGSQIGTISMQNCSGGQCLATYTPATGAAYGIAQFRFRVKVKDQSQPGFWAWTNTADATIDLSPYYTVTGRNYSANQVVQDDGFGNLSVIPNTEVAITISLGNGYTQAHNVANLGALKFLNTFTSAGSIINASVSGGQWTGTFRSTDYWFGDIYLQYQVCATNCDVSTDIKSPVEADQAKWIKIHIEPSDIPPVACAKSAADSLIVYKNTAKAATFNKADQCTNGVWYKDMNNGDLISSVTFYDPLPPGTIAGANDTSCVNSGADRVCTCGTQACGIIYTPPTDMINSYTVNYKVKTHSTLLDIHTPSNDFAALTFNIVDPLTPVAHDLTFNINEDVPLNVALTPGSGYSTVQQINAAYLPAPDGYPMVATASNIVSYDTNAFSSVVVTDCTSGTCNLAITPKVDASGTGLITYNVVANGLTSANKTITINIAAIDDAPNAYGLAQTDLRFNRRQLFAVSWGRHEGTFYQNSVGQPVNLVLTRWNGHPSLQSIGQGTWTNQVYGYFDVDNNNATKVRIGSITGGTINYAPGKDANDAFTCDASGTCTAEFIPNGSVINGYASFSYWVTAGGQEQTQSSAYNVYVAGVDTAPVAYHLPDHNVQDPDINNASYNPDFVLPRNGTLNILIRRGTTEAYTKNLWGDYPDTELAGKVQIGDGSNGAPAPSGLTLGQSTYTCSSGSCVLDVQGLASYPNFPAEANFWYRVVANEGYSYGGYNFNNNLRTYSDWKKVTFKVVLNAGVGCDEAPSLYYDRFITYDAIQGQSINFTVGAGGVDGSGYSHSGTGANWRPLKEIQILNTSNGSVTAIDCTTTFGTCTATFNPTGVLETPADPSDDYVGLWPNFQIKALDDYGCPSQAVYWYANIQPKVSTRGVCEFDPLSAKTCVRGEGYGPNVAQNSTLPLQFRKRDTKAINDFNNFEYETHDNANATKVVLFNFNNEALMRSPSLSAAFTGAGVSCSTGTGSLVCETTNCDAQGTCSLNFNSTDTSAWGELAFKYKVYVGTVVSDGVWGRYPQNYWPYMTNDKYYHEGDAPHAIFVKTKPAVTNPSAYVMGVNDTIDIQIGKEDAPNSVYGYTYADTTNFADKSVQINFSNSVNGSILESSFDQTTRIATLRFRPDFNFDGVATLNYRVTVWGVQSDLGTISINVRKYLNVNNRLASVPQDTATAIAITKGTHYTYQTPYAFDAIAMEVGTTTYSTTIPGADGSFSAPSCDASGNCSTTYTPPAGYYGSKAFKYRLKAGSVGSQYWSAWKDLTIDVVQSEVPPIVYNMNLTGEDETAKLISITKAPDVGQGSSYGYTDANNDLATKLYISNLANGSTSPVSPVTCANGICLVSFTPTAGFHGNASFQFNVEANSAQAVTPASVTVDFVPQLRATSATATTSRNQAKVLTIAHAQGYTYNPGALVTDIELSNILPVGSTANGSCTSGSCTVTFTPATDYSGAASFNYVVKVISGGVTLKTSNAGTASITVNATDTAPVATDFTATLPNHNAYVVTRALSNGYTDAESDKATAITIVSSTGTAAITDNSCNAAGSCTFTFTPLAGFAGTAEVTYKVTANGLQSNTAKIRLTVPVDSSIDFNLSWNGSPTIGDTCAIAIPGQIQLLSGTETCGQTSCTSSSGLIDSKVTTSGNSSSYTGISGVYNKIGTLGEFLTQWQVTATGGQTAILYRYLNLAEGTPSTVKAPVLALTPTPEMAMEGSQMLTGGCTGSSCSTQKLGSIASGNGFSCAMMPDTSIECWGSNARGKLGYNNTVDTESLTPVKVRDPYDPDYDLIGALAVAAGEHHACALLTNRRVICWGDNTYGQLGNNTSGSDSAAPVFVAIDGSGTPLTTVAGISVGANHSCAVTQGRKAYCWGRNDQGQLGVGSTTNSLIATPVKKVTSKTGDTVNTTADLDAVFSISAGVDHTCAVRMDLDGSNNIVDSRALCWGGNDLHQVGDHNYHSTTETDLTKIGTGAGYAAEDSRLYPVMVRDSSDSAVSGIISVITVEKGACALTNAGTVKCWGGNTSGQTGTNNSTFSAVIDVTSVVDEAGTGTLSNVATLSGGRNHVCALHKNRTLTCWGFNTNGELGDNSTTARIKPVAVTGIGGTGSLAGVFAVAAGYDHTCALTSSGLVQCFGKNNLGQLGVNDTNVTSSLTPVTGVIYGDASAFHGSLRECSKIYQITVP